MGVVNTARQEIQWGDSQKYDSGLAPAVAFLDDGTVISVHQTSFFGSYATYYHVGSVDTEHKSITLGNSISYGRGRELSLPIKMQWSSYTKQCGETIYAIVLVKFKVRRKLLHGEKTQCMIKA